MLLVSVHVCLTTYTGTVRVLCPLWRRVQLGSFQLREILLAQAIFTALARRYSELLRVCDVDVDGFENCDCDSCVCV